MNVSFNKLKVTLYQMKINFFKMNGNFFNALILETKYKILGN